ncbi:MAG: 30S ribosome-binding factor RbfA [Pseudomonadota bacterium]
MTGKRAIRVGDQLMKEIAGLLMEKVKDPRIEGTTITGVSLSADLKNAKVYYSMMGKKEDIARVQAGLDSAKGFIKKQIGIRMDLRYVPDIVFKYDPSLEMGNEMESLFQRLKGEESIE